MTEPRIIKFTIDGTPQQKRSPKLTRINTPHGQRAAAIPDSKNTINIASIHWLIRQAGWSTSEPIHCGAVRLEVASQFTIPASWSAKRCDEMWNTQAAMINMPDADRLANMIMDAAKGVVFKDDSQVFDLHSLKFHTHNQPRVDVTITLYPCQYHVLKTSKKEKEGIK